MSTRRNRRTAGWLLPASAAALVLAGSLVTGALGAFTASITNDTNTAGLGSLAMTETWNNGTTDITCTTSGTADRTATCSTINKYGGDKYMAPGDTATTTITLTNSGTLAVDAATLAPGTCKNYVTATNVETSTQDLCGAMTITITEDGTQIYSGLASAMPTSIALKAPASGGVVTYVITASVPTTVSGTLEGVYISQPLVWNYSAGS